MRQSLLCLLILMAGGCSSPASASDRPALTATDPADQNAVRADAGPVLAPPPNIVLIISDDQAWNDYGFMNHPHIQTPHLDRLASESALFTRGYVPHSLCRPSLASIITGKHPHQHGIAGNDPAPVNGKKQGPVYQAARLKMVENFNRNETIPNRLATRDYLSLQTGKWWEGHYENGGFTHGMTVNPPRGGRHGDAGLAIGRQTMKPVFDFIDEAQEKNKPFFLWYAPLLPHDPHNPPQRLLDLYKDKTDSIHIARYWAMVHWWDETCGQVMEHLDRKGLAENTIVIYVTDNGWIQNPAAPSFAPRSKRSQYDGGLRTPIMIRWPGKVQPMRDDQTLVSSLDLMPTILAACGVKLAEELPGVNLLDLCGPDAPIKDSRAAKRDAIFGDIYDHDQPDIDDPTKGRTHRWCIAGNYKLIIADADGKVELFNIMADPHEKMDLSKTIPEVVTRLKDRIERGQ